MLIKCLTECTRERLMNSGIHACQLCAVKYNDSLLYQGQVLAIAN